ncbi:MAG: DUF4430 domain-containing protein [Acholeplasmataceae bacterium]
MNKRNLIIKIISSIIALGLIITSFVFLSKREEAKHSGTITVELIDIDNTLLSTDEINFKKGDTLLGLLEANYEVEYQMETFGAFIIRIGDLYAPNRFETFIKIEVNGVMSSVGVSSIKLVDQMRITFRLTKVDT